MDLSSGTRVGSYVILAPIGAGGMGSVYRARDTRLGREVALKFCAEQFSERFTREARVIAALNHPNICQLYDVGENYLVMELVAGDSPRGPLSVETAFNYARQIADALEAAHEKGIVHRDLKPANIKITPDGVVKVLDFGLAKELSLASEADDLSALPTSPLGERTQSGVIVGTAAYMAPEQAQGKAVDKRSDIWAFGIVLYELLTGERPFQGDSLADMFAAVLTKEPDWERVPSQARLLLRRCLVKNPKHRLRDIGDAMTVLEAERVETEPQTAGSPRWLPWSVAAVCASTMAVALWVPWRNPASRDDSVIRWILNAESSVLPTGFDLSRDGKRLVYARTDDSQGRLWVRDLNQPEARPIVGTENGSRAFFSPDGQWFAFFTRGRMGQLRKVPVAGGSFNTRGAVTTLCDGANYYGGSWGEGDQIIFSGPSGLMQVNASGGPCEAISKADPKEGDHRWPQILPGGESVLFTIGIEGAFDSARIAVLDLNTGLHRTVLEGGANARYVPSGHLVFVRGGEMFAVPFDLDRLQANGVPEVVVESIFYASTGGFAAYAFTDTGLLLYATPSLYGFEWRDRRGITQPVSAPPVFSLNFRLSPDGTRVALTQSGRGDIAILTLDKGLTERVTSEGTNGSPIWSADGRAVTFRTLGKGIFRASLDGGGLEPLTEHDGAPADWASDRKTLLYYFGDPVEIWTLTLQEDGSVGERRQLLAGSNIAYWDPDVSPDGRWLAYVSNESGQPQVYVRPFPGPGNKVIISKDTGLQPRWSPDGRELFYYVSATRSVMEVDVLQTSPEFRASPPHLVLSSVGQANPPQAAHFDVDPTGRRFLVTTETKPAQLNLVTNWFEELRQKVPLPKRW